MISGEELTCIGTLLKPHGIKGEIVAELDFDIDLAKLRCIVLDVDGIFVPFFLESVRSRSSHSSLISIDEIDDEVKAKELCGKDLFALSSDLAPELTQNPDSGFYLSDLIGYDFFDKTLGKIGKISDYDDSTDNYLLIVESSIGGKKVFIPLAEEFITEINESNGFIVMDLPEGLVELN